MKRSLISLKTIGIYFFVALFLITGLLPSNMQAQTNQLIDREIFFGNPEISGAQLSPDGKYMTFVKPYQEVRNIWIKKTNEPFDAAKPLTNDTKRPIPGYFWTHDSKYVLFVQDKGGNENFHVYAVDPSGAPAEGDDVPEARNLTPMDEVRAIIYSVPESNPDMMYVGLNNRDAAWHDLYEVKISSGERKLIRENTEKVSSWVFDQQDQLRMATRSTDDGGTEILRVDQDGFHPIYSCNVEESCSPSRFHKDGKLVYFVSNKGEDVDLTSLFLMDPQTGKTTLVESDPENEVDYAGASFSDVTKEMVATFYYGAKRRMYIKDKNFQKDFDFLTSKLPGAQVNFGSSTKDENLWLISATSDVDPGATYLYNRKEQTLVFQYRPRPELPVDQLVPMEPLTYTSNDGMKIPAYLSLPKGKSKNLPTIIMPHGGPWARDYWGYNSYAQFWANRGYAVLQANFRSSTGYGKKFLNAGNGEWGESMQDDLTAGVKYLIEQGIADPDRVAIMGGSYGGYATLAGLTFTPDVYAAGVSIVGPSNLLTLLESIPPYWESIRKMFYIRMGDPETEEGKAQLMKQSPLFSANKIKVPLMVVQGANDPRVKKAESDQIVVAMRELKLPVEYICAPDEGHGFRRPENNMAFIAAAEKFLAKHIGGQYQADMLDDIAKRLEEITVDINTVALPKKMDESAAKVALPKPAAALTMGTFSYKTTVKMGDQEMAMDVKNTIAEKDGHVSFTSTVQSAMGQIVDSYMLDSKNLTPMSRSVDQGPISVKLNHGEGKISGTMAMNGNERPIEVSNEDGIFGDGAALEATIASLPLKEGYECTYRVFDVQAQKVKPYKAKVMAKESVTVPAGTYEAYKVDLISLDDTPGSKTIWVTTEGKRCMVKGTAVVPQMGGAVVTSELTAVE
ncbi:MAG: prolyl oligopeptidase family serine peptidase [Bacteroidota bacterium]